MPEKCFYDISNVKKHDKPEYPDFIARFYDTLYDSIRSGLDYNFYLKKITECKGPVLEVGVGTGRLFKDALEKGADIYGIDISKNMIDILRKKITEQHHNRVFVKDVCEMNLGMKFDLIIAPFRVFQHILDTDDQLTALNNIYRHLNSGCSFIFDVFVPNLKILLNDWDNFPEFDGEYEPGKKLKRYISTKADLIKQEMDITMVLEWEENGEIVKKEWHFRSRYFFRYELENLVRLSDLRLVNIYGDFNGGELSDKSEDFVMICRNDPLKYGK